MRDEILNLLHNKRAPAAPPAFSGLIHVTAQGLQHEGLIFHEVHNNAAMLARAAGSTHKLSGLPSAVLPLDLYVEAEALGAEINFRADREFEFPQVKQAGLFQSARELNEAFERSGDFMQRGRIHLICEAMRMLKADIGDRAVVGGMIPGPYTLLLLVVQVKNLFIEMNRDPQRVRLALERLTGLLAQVGLLYRKAGADFITVHDMGGSPGFIGPVKYEQFVLPYERELLQRIGQPNVLSVCGNVTSSLGSLVQSGAGAISIDQTVDLVTARRVVQDSLLFGNLDPVQTLQMGTPNKVADSAKIAREAGVDAVWPGCDLTLRTPIENISALFD